MTKKQIEKKVEECLSTLQEIVVPVPIVEIAHNLNIEVHEVMMPHYEQSGKRITAALTKDKTKSIILLNELEEPLRKRFAIAHTLGHIVLHDMTDTIDLFTYGEVLIQKDNLLEKEASYFALCLLMPRDLLEKEWNETKSIDQVAKEMAVSSDSLTARLVSLEILENVV